MLFALPSIDPKILDGTILADLTLGYNIRDSGSLIRRMMSELDEYYWHIFPTFPLGSSEEAYCIFNLALPNVAKAHDILQQARDLPGTKNARIDFEEDHMILFENVEKYLERKLAQAGVEPLQS